MRFICCCSSSSRSAIDDTEVFDVLRELGAVVLAPAVEAASKSMLFCFFNGGPCGGGIDLADDLSNAQFDEIHQAFLDHHVIFFRDQSGLSPDAQKRFARRFGTLNVHPYVQGMDGHPELLEIIKEPDDKLNFGGGWHSDMSFLECY